ncbi:hypothetical protein [Ideonella sp.]|uniref:hypothetical protein n=1 Tax=Ideonella sp. TaxID=1929293 RepID=UPI003BB6B575
MLPTALVAAPRCLLRTTDYGPLAELGWPAGTEGHPALSMIGIGAVPGIGYCAVRAAALPFCHGDFWFGVSGTVLRWKCEFQFDGSRLPPPSNTRA